MTQLRGAAPALQLEDEQLTKGKPVNLTAAIPPSSVLSAEAQLSVSAKAMAEARLRQLRDNVAKLEKARAVQVAEEEQEESNFLRDGALPRRIAAASAMGASASAGRSA